MLAFLNKIKKLTPLTILGALFVLISNLGWIGAAVIPFIPWLSIDTKEILVPGFVIGGQILFYVGLALLGKHLAKRLGKKSYLPRKLFRSFKYFCCKIFKK